MALRKRSDLPEKNRPDPINKKVGPTWKNRPDPIWWMYRAWAKTFVPKNPIQSKNYTWKIRFYLFGPTICQAKPELKNPIPWFFITRSDLNLTRSDRSSGLSGLGGSLCQPASPICQTPTKSQPVRAFSPDWARATCERLPCLRI